MKTIIHADLYSSITGAVYNEHILPSLEGENKVIAFNLLESPEICFPKKLEVFCAKGNMLKLMRNLLEVSKRNNIIFNFHSVHLSVFLILGLLFPNIRKMKKIHTVHTSFGNYKLRNKIFSVLSYLISDRVIFCSNSSYESHPKILKKYLDNKYSIIQNGVNLKLIDSVKTIKKGDIFTIVFLGRLIELKKPLFIIKTFLRDLYKENIELKIIGEGELKNEIEKIIKESDTNEKISLEGLLPRKIVYEKLKSADLLISASKIEGFPIAVLEGIGCKCGVILSDIPPHRELKNEIKNIILFDNENMIELEDQIKKYIKKSKEIKEKENQENYNDLKNKFSLEKVLEKYELEYRKILEEGEF